MSITSIHSSPAPITSSHSSHNASALFDAVKSRNRHLTTLLLKEGADPNKEIRGVDGSIRTPFHAAVEEGDLDLAELLLIAGANPNAEIQVGSSGGGNIRTTILYTAICQGDLKMVELLLRAGASPNQVGYKSQPKNSSDVDAFFTPLHRAINNGLMRKNSEKIVDLLLRYGADVNQQSRMSKNEYFTPLTAAMNWRQQIRCIRLLLLAGADPFKSVINSYKNHFSPMELAIESNDLSLMGLLFAGAKKIASKIDIHKVVQKLIETSNASMQKRIPLHFNKSLMTRYEETIMITTIPHDKMNIKTLWTNPSFHEKVKECVDASYAAANPFITSIAGYLDKGVRDKKPQVLHIVPQNESIEKGHFNSTSKNIILRVLDAGEISADTLFSVYVHEHYHAMLDASSLHFTVRFKVRARGAANIDFRALKARNWPCDSLIKEHLYQAKKYPDDKCVEEYVVRVPQMIVELQQKHKCTWQEAAAMVEKALPNLYKIVKEEVLPRLNEAFK
jgi:ankyrin repeat protein